MFGSLGGAEILMVLVLALLLFGPRRLPQIGRTIGRAMSEFRKATQEFKSSLDHEVEFEKVRDIQSGLQSAGRDISQAVNQANPLTEARRAIADGLRAGETADKKTTTPAAEPPETDERSPGPSTSDAPDNERS